MQTQKFVEHSSRSKFLFKKISCYFVLLKTIKICAQCSITNEYKRKQSCK